GPAIVKGGVSATAAGLPFAIVTSMDDEVPRATLPKSSGEGVTTMPGVPVPASATSTELPVAVLTVSVAVLPPTDDGAKATGIDAIAPPARFAAGGVTLNIAASAPPIAGALSATGPMKLFFTDAVPAACSPTLTFPKSTGAAVSPRLCWFDGAAI